jgi:uncharacterized membrane protein
MKAAPTILKLGAVSLALAALLASAPARAEWRVCNKTGSLLNLAIGSSAKTDFATEGWWTVTPGSCSTPIHGPLASRFLYLYAIDINGADVTKGTVSMCVDSGKFRIVGIADCWRRGLQAANFMEIDTAEASEWTTFLSELAK